MLGRVASALIRREADAYRAQGLQEEALALFRKALAASPPLSPDVKAGIEQEIQQIEAEMAGAGFDEGQQLSEEQIAVIRCGWCDDATTDELLVCADSFRALGRYGDALLELRKAVQKGYSLHKAIGLVADCLVHLHEPEQLQGVVTDLAAEMVKNNQERFNLTLLLAEQMWKIGNGDHAAAIARLLSELKGISRNDRTRVEALLENLKPSKAPKKPLPTSDAPTMVNPSRFRPVSEWIRKVFSFARR